MKHVLKLIAPLLIIGLMAGNCWSAFIYGDIGSEITIPDLNTNNSGNSWYNSDNEDQETEPGTVTKQIWDLEAMYLNPDGELTLIGGYDFLNGVSNLHSGDIFIDVTGDALYGDLLADYLATPGAPSITPGSTIDNFFGYDYVLDLDFSTPTALDATTLGFTYDVYSIDDTATLLTATENVGLTSNPWRYDSGGTPFTVGDTGVVGQTMTYYAGLSDADVGGLEGDTNSRPNSHFAFTVDLDFLPDTDTGYFMAHYTMECGNDNLMGDPSAVPEPMTTLLLGGGLMGLAAFRRFTS